MDKFVSRRFFLRFLGCLSGYALIHTVPVLSAIRQYALPPAHDNLSSRPSLDKDKKTETLPSELLNLSNWKLTLPTGDIDHPTEILQPQLKDSNIDPWFIVTEDRAVRFRAPVTGVTTSGSEYPRSELREMKEGGDEKAAWSSTEGVHKMVIDEAITALPRGKQHVVAGQIHDSEDDVIQVRLEGTKLKIDIYGEDGPVLTEDYKLGDRFTVAFEVEAGKTRVYYNGELVLEVDGEYDGAYFKAGVYTQSNCEKEAPKDCNDDNFGEVIIYGLNIVHS